MTGWIITGVLAVILLALLFGPVDLKLTLDRPLLVGARLTWFGVPLPLPKGRRRKPKKADAPRKGGKPWRWRALARLDLGRAVIAVARTPGVPAFTWDIGKRAMKLVWLVRARLVVSLWLADPAANAWLFGALAFVQPRMMAGRGRVQIEVAPDLTGQRFGAEGEMVVRTRLAFWLALGLRVLLAPETWRARAAWREARQRGPGKLDTGSQA